MMHYTHLYLLAYINVIQFIQCQMKMALDTWHFLPLKIVFLSLQSKVILIVTPFYVCSSLQVTTLRYSL